jgi:hypothetical protein
MRQTARSSTRKSAAVTKALSAGNGAHTPALGLAPSRVRKQWRFAADAIGMVSGPRDLSQRKGLSA